MHKNSLFQGREGKEKEYLIVIIWLFKEDSGKIFLFIAYLQYKLLNNSRSLNSRASRICEASVEALALDRTPLVLKHGFKKGIKHFKGLSKGCY